MYKRILIGLALIAAASLPVSAQSEDNEQLINLLVVSKATGMCGTLKQLSAFQESTQMTGGNEFLLRFISTEAARLGKTLPELLGECESSVAIYTRTMEELGYQ
jgi:hypothetical protein